MIKVTMIKVTREPREGDVYEVTTDLLIAGGRTLKQGTRLKLGQTTLANPQGNFWVSVNDEEPTVWDSIHMIIDRGWITLVAETPQEESRANPFWDRLAQGDSF